MTAREWFVVNRSEMIAELTACAAVLRGGAKIAGLEWQPSTVVEIITGDADDIGPFLGLRVSDHERGRMVRMAAEIEWDHVVHVDRAFLLKVLKALPGDVAYASATEGAVVLSFGSVSLEVPILHGVTPAPWPKMDEVNHLDIQGGRLTAALRQILPSVDGNTEANETGVRAEMGDQRLHLMATDRRQMSYAAVTAHHGLWPAGGFTRCQVPPQAIGWLRALPDDPLRVSFPSGFLVVSHGESTTWARTVEAFDLDWRMVLDCKGKHWIDVETSALLATAKRAALYRTELRPGMLVQRAHGGVTVTAGHGGAGGLTEDLECDRATDPTAICVDAVRLASQLAAVPAERVRIEWDHPHSAALVRWEGQAETEGHVLMPIRLETSGLVEAA